MSLSVTSTLAVLAMTWSRECTLQRPPPDLKHPMISYWPGYHHWQTSWSLIGSEQPFSTRPSTLGNVHLPWGLDDELAIIMDNIRLHSYAYLHHARGTLGNAPHVGHLDCLPHLAVLWSSVTLAFVRVWGVCLTEDTTCNIGWFGAPANHGWTQSIIIIRKQIFKFYMGSFSFPFFNVKTSLI